MWNRMLESSKERHQYTAIWVYLYCGLMMKGFSDSQLIFLVSQPRAGSTLLQHVLAGQKEIHATAEPWLMLHPVYALREGGQTAEYDARLARRALHDFLQSLPLGEAAYWTAVRGMALSLYGQACSSVGKSLFLDKTPRYYYILTELAQIFPAARFIILFRNPLAVLHSVLNTWVRGEWVRLSMFRDDLLLAPGLLADGVTSLAERVFTLQYEALVERPEVEVRALCHWLDVGYEPQMLAYGERKRLPGRYGDPVGLARYERPSVGSRDKWLELGRTPQMRHLAEAYLQTLGPVLLARMGYEAAELQRQLSAVPCQRGKIRVRWSQLFPSEDAQLDRLRLVWAGWRETKDGLAAVRQLWRVVGGKR
jgi:hypothetical protein